MARKPAQDKWDAANMASQNIRVKKTLLDDFKAACAARGDAVNGVLRECMERYVTEYDAMKDFEQETGNAYKLPGCVASLMWHNAKDESRTALHYLWSNPDYSATLMIEFDAINQAVDRKTAKRLCDELEAKVLEHMKSTETAPDGQK